jgi:3-oxoacyl-[acyl-carrier-protein] synthase-3
MNTEVFIVKVATYLPNDPVDSDTMEKRLGLIGNKPSRVKSIILRQNKINTRYYAIDESGNITHTNAQLTAGAIDKLFTVESTLHDVELLSCGTSSPDQLLPSHASIVHGELNGAPTLEIMSCSGLCGTSTMALKYGYTAVKSGCVEKAVCTGSELFSPLLLAKNFEIEYEKLKEVEENPLIAFEKDFLRFMLSDGAGACLLSNTPAKTGLSLKIEWMESISYANELKTCMYQGAEKDKDGNLISWKLLSEQEWLGKSIFSIKQDSRYLGKNVFIKAVEIIKKSLDKHNIKSADIDFFLPHISSMYFYEQFKSDLASAGYPFSDEKWFINLPKVGNVGSASVYLMLDELINSGKLKKNQKILIINPESGRFYFSTVLLTVV